MSYAVDPDITVASTLDAAFYRDEEAFALARERIFARCWQWIGDLGDVAGAGSLSPRTLLPGVWDEPLLLARDAAGTLRCLANVCTHRGNILVKEPRAGASEIRCGYHSRRFDLSGRMTFMPEFALAKNFPSPSDDLPGVPFAAWANHGFAAIDPVAPLDAFIGDLTGRVATLPVDRARADAASSRDYVVGAHWALYVENYLEGFHIPFVHAGLNRVVDYGTYADELFRYSSLQVAFAKDADGGFESPVAADPRGRVAACYWWIFPNLMLNVYPWGISLNRVVPEAVDRTRVEFRAYVWDEEKRGRGAGAALHEVELEDEAVVEAVQRGVRSRFYRGGRYSPARERGTHHFHRLLCEFMRDA
ncbi:MAG TPA: SRPBCC family protein [Casimicrobiaceae bacterium]|nr:SRPBCC family protein [Casimicrobiaceae bacterium]